MPKSWIIAVAALGVSVGQASAQQPDFAGKTVEWTVPFSEGGGTDTLARFITPFFSKHLPGSPTVLVRNVPAAGRSPAPTSLR